MANAKVFDMPVELGLELVTTIGPDRLDSEWETLDHVVDERNRMSIIRISQA